MTTDAMASANSTSVWVIESLEEPSAGADNATGDTKAGTLIGTDKFGNKYYENMADELPGAHFLLIEPISARLQVSERFLQHGHDGWTTRSTTLTRTLQLIPRVVLC